jgi:hypothetical protein
MKLNEIYLTHPEIFVSLSLEQQAHILSAAELDTSNLQSPLTNYRVSWHGHYEDIWTFSGYAQKGLAEKTTHIVYWNEHSRLEFAR